MSTDNIPSRSNLQVIDQTWFNLIQQVLGSDFVPRSSGIPTSLAGNLGTTTYAWNQACLQKLMLLSNGNTASISPPAGLAASYNLTLPAALPASTAKVLVDSSGNILTSTNSSVFSSSPTGNADSYNSVTPVDVTNLTLSIPTSGRPVFVALLPTSTAAAVSVNTSLGTNPIGADVYFVRGSTTVSNHGLATSVPAATSVWTMQVPPSAFFFLDVVAAGTYTYKVQVSTNSTAVSAIFSNVQLVAFEI